MPSRVTPTSDFTQQLMQSFKHLQPVPTAWHRRYDAERPFVSPSLAKSAHVFVRVDCHRAPLTPPYKGPYKVLERGDKAYTIDNNGKPDIVSIDRLKPAHMERSSEPEQSTARVNNRYISPALSNGPCVLSQSPTPAVWTRSGRRVQPSDRFS